MHRISRVALLIAVVALAAVGAAGTLHGHSARAQGGLSVTVVSPTNSATVSNPVTVRVQSSGVTIKAATEGDPNAGHYHYFVDRNPSTVVQQGQPIPSGQPDIIHSGDANQALPNLAPGQHTVWVVLAHTDHTPYNPNVQTSVTFTVGTAAQATPAPGAARAATPSAPGSLPANGDDFSMLKLLVVSAALVFAAGGYATLRLTGARRSRP